MRSRLAVSMFVCGACLTLGAANSASGADGSLVLRATKVYTSADAPPIENAVITIRDGKIAEVRSGTDVSKGTPVSECGSGVVTAGFQNSHVHFIGDAYFGAKTKPSAELADEIRRMLTRYGYTTVVDTSSDLENTNVIRRRIADGEIAGPRILTVGAGVFPADGLPIYIAHLPKRFLDLQLTPGSPEEALRLVRKNLADGADATKLFVATPQADYSVKRMLPEIARAVAEATHEQHKLVMVHPTDIEGVRLALAAKADVLVHTTLGAEEPWPEDVLQQLLREKVAIAPTFKLLEYELRKQNVPEDISDRLMKLSLEHFKPFVAGGGTVIFGTDVGYMTDYDPTAEYVLMHKAGMTPAQILASLTTAPARLWKEQASRGRIEPGMAADLVVLRADPAEDVRRFADVRCAIRAGKVIYQE